MSEAQKLPVGSAFSSRWQIPLLAIGAAMMGSGLLRIASAHEAVTVEQRFDRIHRLREAGALTRANAYIIYLLKDPGLPTEERGELHRLLAGTIHQAEVGFRKHGPENRQAIIIDFHKAVQYGATPDGNDWVALGDAYRWSGRTRNAIDAYRQAIRQAPRRADRIRRVLVELQTHPGKPLSPLVLEDLEAILDDDGATPNNYMWALRRKMEWLLAHNETQNASQLLDAGKSRLAGTSESLGLSFVEALYLRKVDRAAEAEARLRSLRNNWTLRDELWGEAGWLLGRIQQEDDRPQAALSFYEEVLRGFQSGRIHDACKLGRAECLVMLERYERALDEFVQLKDRSLRFADRIHLDSDALRTTIATIGELRLQAGDLGLGIRFLELAMTLVDGSDSGERSRYLSRIAGSLVKLARREVNRERPAATEDDAATDRPEPDRARAFLERAAALYLEQADLILLDEPASAEAMLRAADVLNEAGLTDRMIDVLSRFVREHPSHKGRPTALSRLGQAYQAVQNYPAAIVAYERAISDYPRNPEALGSVVPLAESLMRAGGDNVRRGVELLLDIVDDRGPALLFGPRANEYRRAMFRLVEYYSQASEKDEPGHWEKAIARLEDAIALYPEDVRIPRLKFLLAEAYRRSAKRLAEDEDAGVVAAAREEIEQRLRSALAAYREIRDILAAQKSSELSELEETYLRAAHLYVGDCLFDLGELSSAVETYREVVWRYENQPAAVYAAMQVIHCYHRLGWREEARAALERLGWIVKKIPAAEFDAGRGMTSKAYWEAMVERMKRTGV